ncbi:Putative transposase [Xenorhabdus nematophila ATCC 19061]|uniref:Transposase n=1 Tax=Xenorhabdus nematophila (strain ATCC 19061 / DSM 3370 / CCUG 14189 / LMG 1036 / NCIMB 9965 / AN6) TaxID=406817 RepID=D3VE41_XENNA|nr:IS66-like element accessory protein TnpA [Xenorhabdus nematophila]CBJ92292.1 Putative transposase [Xenorhabdus nematophila ATCC 19061]CEK25107.1 Putative transposase [Xenorhabdus nematophila AN6/1]
MKYRTLLLDALRLHFDEHLSRLDVGRRLGIPKSTICALFVRFKKLGMSWPLPDNMTADKLESQLYPARTHAVRLDIPAPVLADEPVVRKRSCRPNFPLAFKISLAEKSLQPGANVAQLAREHGINDNLLFNWRHLYKRGLLCPREDRSWLLPVTQPVSAMQQPAAREPCCELALPAGILRIRGELTSELLRMLISEMKGGGCVLP